MPRLLLVATWLLVAWGALAFGAVYPWAWRPLIAGCAVVGIASWMVARRNGAQSDIRGVMVSLACVALGATLQLVPLSRETRLAISPASEAILLDLHLDLGLPGATADDGSTPAPVDFPLSIEPEATRRGLVLLVGLALLLAGLTRLLAITGARRLCTWLVAFGAALALFAIIQFAILGDRRLWRHAHLRLLEAEVPVDDALRAVREQEPLRRLDADGPAPGDRAWARLDGASHPAPGRRMAQRGALAVVT